jgi:3-(3-hydroxy-phenyl)propionate hydroxylase
MNLDSARSPSDSARSPSDSARSPSDYDVCIVGLGPTGLTLAHLLGRRGVRVLVLEREPEFYGLARAVYTDDECLRIFQNAGVADQLHAQMNADSIVQWVRADGSVLAQFHNPRRPYGWPVSNFLYQPSLENTLEERLADLPHVTIRRGREVIGFEQDAHGVTVAHIESLGGWGKDESSSSQSEASPELVEPSRDHVGYLIGADGGRSIIRQQLGITMTGKSFPQRWLVLDLKARAGVDAFRHLPYFDFVCDPALPTVSCPQPYGRHRFEFMLHDSDLTGDFKTAARAHDLLAKYVDVDEVEIDRQLVYTFNALVADQWRAGRVLLAGDAAHMTPQFIGQGMNAGVRDADNLSWKLADVILRSADPALLDTYESERRPHAKAMIDLSVFNKDIVSTQHRGAIRARELGIGLGTKLPGIGAFITEAKMKPKPRFKRRTYVGLPRRVRGVEGTVIPQPQVRTYDGRATRLDDALGHGWVVLGVAVDPRTVATDDIWERLGATWATYFPPGTRPQGTPGDGRRKEGLVDVEGVDFALEPWLKRAGAGAGSVIVLRPDKYVFSIDRLEAASLAARKLLS